MRNHKLSNLEISDFCNQLTMVVEAGLPTYYGVSLIRNDCNDPKLLALLSDIYQPLEEGKSLHEALEATGAFPSYLTQMVALGDATGKLEDILRSLAIYYEREEHIRTNLRHALTYPVIMTTLMIAVLIALITKVLPIFAEVYEELGADLNSVAQNLLAISNFMNRYLLVIVIALVVLFLGIILTVTTKWGHKLLSRQRFAMSIAASRFANCMSMALSSGLTSEQGMKLAYDIVENSFMQAKIDRCIEYRRNGESTVNALLMAGIFSQTYASLINIGTRTGSMEKVFAKISDTYQEETDAQIDLFLATLEPTLIIGLCFIVGLILISFLLPLLGIMSSIG